MRPGRKNFLQKGIQMSGNRRQDRAKNIIMKASKRMLARLFNLSPKTFEKEKEHLFTDEEMCDAIRSLYGRTQEKPDNLTKAYDLASLVR